MSDYDTDFVAWSEQQAALLRRMAAGERINSNELDWANIAEEIESLARSDKREIRSRLSVICEHLLKWQFRPSQRSGSWRGSIIEARSEIADLIEESPSLASYPDMVLHGPRGAYARGPAKAAAETGLENLPGSCPWTVEQVLDLDFWPDA